MNRKDFRPADDKEFFEKIKSKKPFTKIETIEHVPVKYDKKTGKYVRDTSKKIRVETKRTKFKHHSESNVDKTLHHKDILGEGAKKRKHLKGSEKVEAVMKEYKRGTLYSGSGKKVKTKKQALAIAMSEQQRSEK